MVAMGRFSLKREFGDMNYFHNSDLEPMDGRKLPGPVHDSVVRSLYKDQKSLLVGTLSMFVAPLVLYFRTHDTAQLWFSALLLLCGSLRLIDGHWFKQAAVGALDSAAVKRWENRYAILASLYVGVLGLWCFAGFARNTDEFVHLMGVALTLSYIVGVFGRNFSSERVVQAQILCAGVPMIAGVLLKSDPYHFILGLFLVPLFFTIWLMSQNLRQILFSAVVTAIDNKTIAERFDIALSNISHGMAMVSASGKFVVANSRFAALVGLPDTLDTLNQGLDILPQISATRQANHANAILLAEMCQECLQAGQAARFRHVLQDGTMVETSYNPTAGGGGVFVLEDVTERLGSEEESRKLASFDPLTHLPNRRFFDLEVHRLLMGRSGLEPCSIFFLDLDNFKDINDTLGHATGDKLLCSVALRMRSRMPEKGMVCRFGGDEFVIVVPGKMRRKDCSALADQVSAEIAKPMVIDGHTLSVGASIGIAQCPANGRDYNQLLKVSDVALYDAKARGRGCHSFYSDELGDVVRDRRALENDLRQALGRGQMQLHFQPLVDVNNGRIRTCEALLRWQHPERGAVSPMVFIPIAEEIGIITQIGKFVMEKAAQTCMKWPEDISVAVNVSSLQFQQSDVCALVKEALASSGLDPRRLEVEVTESAMLLNIAETTQVLSRLADSGVRISLDDFGTGFSSLSYLHQLPLDKVKIDRSFIENIESDEKSLVLLSGVTHLARDLGLSITIEGVETVEQMQILRDKVHVDEMQGYLFGRPVPADDIARLLQAQSKHRDVSYSQLQVAV